MRWTKKGLLVLTVGSLLATTIGCAAGGQSTTASGSAKTSEVKPITIQYWHVNSKDWGGDAVTELVQKFNDTHKDIQVEEKYQPGNYSGLLQKVQAALGAGTPPDVSQIGFNFINYVDGNVPYTSVEEVAKRDQQEPNFLKDNYLPNILQLGQNQGGKLAGMPYSVSNPVMYYNADLLKQVGWNPDTPPKTWDDVKKLSAEIRDKTGNYGLYVQEPPDNWAQYALAKSNGGEWLKTVNGKQEAAFNSPEVIETYQMMGDMVQDKRALHTTWEEGVQAFTNGKVAMIITTIGQRGNIQDQSKFDLRTAMFPTFGDKPRAVPAGGNALFIFSKDQKKQDAAWAFIKFLESPESLTVWTKATGYLPPRKGVAEDPNALKPFLDSNRLMKPAVEQMASVVPWVNFPGSNGIQAEQALLDARDQILSGQSKAADALKQAADKVNQLLK